jgi:hypothetical protein
MSSKEERLWWSILCDAELFSEIASNRGDGPLAVRYMRVAGKARVTLRDKFGINLDTLGMKARDQVMMMEKAEEEKEKEEKRKMDDALKILEDVRELLKEK